MPETDGDMGARRRPGPRPGALGPEEGRALPSESTIRRVLKDLDPGDLDARAGLLVLHPAPAPSPAAR